MWQPNDSWLLLTKEFHASCILQAYVHVLTTLVVGGYIIIYYAHGMFHSDGLHSNSANKLIGEDLLLLFLKGKQIRVLRLVRFTLGMLLHAIVSVAFLNRDGQFPVSVLLQSTVILQQPATSPIQSLGKALLTKPSSNCKARETKEEFVSLSKV